MNKKKILIFSAIVFFVSVITTGTVAYYRYGVSGLIKASVGNYTFNVSSGSTTTKEINLGSNLKPFDKGSFNLTVNLNNTDSDAYFSVKIERTNLPKGFKFLAQDDNISPFSTYSKTFKSTDTKSDTVTVYWYWDGNVDDENDTSFVGKSLSADIVIDSKQMNGAYMKNGYSAKSEFWSDTYRTYIRTVSFVKNISNVPSTCDEANLCWDVTESGTKKVYAYLVDSGLKDSTDNTKVLYNLYIASEVEIIAPANCGSIFYFSKYENNKYLSNLIQINFNDNFNTSNVTNMKNMFAGCSFLTSLDLSGFNTSKIIDMSSMFFKCSSLTSLDSNVFNTSKVTSMNYMFYECSSLTSLDLSNFNTSKVTEVVNMFYGCTSLTSLDLSNFNTSNVTEMGGAFAGCTSLTSLDLSNFNTSKVTEMGGMFTNCSSLTTLDLSSFNTSNVTGMDGMFRNCSSLTRLDLSSFNTSNVTYMGWMFYSCSKLTTTINIMSANTTYYMYMFQGAATASGVKITVNYTSATSSLVDSMIATKSSNSNVVKGSLIS